MEIGKTRVRMTAVPFNHRWPSGRVSVVRQLGPALLDDKLAEAAIAAGAAEPFDPVKPARPRSRPRKKAAIESHAADERQPDRVGNAGLAADDSADDQSPMDNTGQR